MEELKPCPFCGGKAFIETVEPHTHTLAAFMPYYGGGTFIECQKCSCAISAETKEEAIEAWNRRVDASVKHGQWIDTGRADYYLNKEYRCSCCNSVDYLCSPYCYNCGAKMDGVEK